MSVTKWVVALAVGAGLVGGAWTLRSALSNDPTGRGGAKGSAIPVETAPIERGPIEQRRELSGTVEASSEFVVAPKVSGRIERLTVDLADQVQRGQVVAQLDDEEYRRARAEAEANLKVVQAELVAAQKALQITKRNFERVEGLRGGNVLSEQELDTARAAKLDDEADVTIASAEVARARAALETARVREGYTKLAADWPEGDGTREVAARYADEGTTVAANTPLLSIVDIDPVVVVVHVTERDYADLQRGQLVRLSTDAYPTETFEGTVDRIAPVFAAQSRQARVELRVPNPDGRLKPGMFVRAETVLDRAEDATIVPEDAVVMRDGGPAVFVLSPDRKTVSLRPVQVGIRSGGRVAVTGDGLTAEVVVLGQQQLDDGSAVTVATAEAPP